MRALRSLVVAVLPFAVHAAMPSVVLAACLTGALAVSLSAQKPSRTFNALKRRTSTSVSFSMNARVFRQPERRDAVRLQAVRGPDALDGPAAHAGGPGHRATTPVGGARRRLVQRGMQDGLHLVGPDFGLAAATALASPTPSADRCRAQQPPLPQCCSVTGDRNTPTRWALSATAPYRVVTRAKVTHHQQVHAILSTT